MGCAVRKGGGDRLSTTSAPRRRRGTESRGCHVYTPTQDATPQPPNPDRPDLEANLRTERVVLQPGEHPFPTKFAIRRTTLRIEPSIYLEALMRDVKLFGGRIVIRKFENPRELMTLAEPIVVNCTGLGARDLFGDKTLVP